MDKLINDNPVKATVIVYVTILAFSIGVNLSLAYFLFRWFMKFTKAQLQMAMIGIIAVIALIEIYSWW